MAVPNVQQDGDAVATSASREMQQQDQYDVSKPLLESMCKDDGVNTTVFFDVQAQLECLRRAATDDFQELCNKIWLQMRLAGF